MSNPARTGTQKALHVVSIIMIVLGVLVILSGASLIALGVSAATMGMDQPMTLGDTETTADTTSVALGIIVLAMGLVQLVVAAFGLRGSKDASKIGPFRILIWGISLVILATILYGWFFNGNWHIQNSPLLLIGNVIYLLVCHCVARSEERYGPGRRPTLRQIEKEGYHWAQRGLFDQESASRYLRDWNVRRSAMSRYMQVLGLGDRRPVESEERYITDWMDKGFPPETVALAYDKTVFYKKELNWRYLNGILRRWHENGWHTEEEVRQSDSRKPSRREEKKDDSRMEKYMKW